MPMHAQGGLTWLWLDAPYVIAARKLFNMALEANNNGDVFPVSGDATCSACMADYAHALMNHFHTCNKVKTFVPRIDAFCRTGTLAQAVELQICSTLTLIDHFWAAQHGFRRASVACPLQCACTGHTCMHACRFMARAWACSYCTSWPPRPLSHYCSATACPGSR